ncbi:MAG: hypothetical protein LBH82_00605 [Bacteroidales bacterium]|jgi:hypothetical protein|nr:hypothetical protein [Bacteroidales bacterium]
MDRQKKKNILWIAMAGVIAAAAAVLVITHRSGTVDESVKAFAVQDTAAITRLFLANAFGDESLLEKDENGKWLLNKKEEVITHNINGILGAICNIRVKDIVGKTARENINKRMASGSTKVEIYYTDYRIKLGRLKWLKYTNKKVYYMGQPTMDNMGNFAILEGSEVPCVVYYPGFRGYIGAKFSPLEDNWRSHTVTRLRRSQIQEVLSLDFEKEDNSFKIFRSSERHFEIFNAQNEKLTPYDTLHLVEFLAEFRELNYENKVKEISEEEKASIFKNKFKEIQITDTQGEKTVITMFRVETEFNEEAFEHDIDFMEAYNRDRFYAVLNGNTDELYLCQFFVFDRIVQPIGYFVQGSNILSIPKIYELED